MAARSAALALLLVATACGGDEDPAPAPQPPNTVALDGEVANDRGSAHVDAEGEAALETGEFFFAPTVLTGAADLDAVLEVRNGGAVRHNLTLPELGIDEDLDPGAAATIAVTFPRSGSTLFFCRFHRDRGMLGTLVAV